MNFRILLKLIWLAVLFVSSLSSIGQLQADFVVDKSSGCTPLALSFVNKTKGASSNARYSWNLGNGNSSIVKDPAAIYLQEQTYQVTLTVTDGNAVSVKTSEIIVYPKPKADFLVTGVKGCAPFEAKFISTSKAGSGMIESYAWGFGDGTTAEHNDSAISHTYLSERVPTISLTVTNSYGCQNSIQKENMLTVLPPLVASFEAEQAVLCKITDPLKLNNNSSGPGNLTYAWDFGDGSVSSQKNPSHVFQTAGTYTTSLTVSSSEGCVTKEIRNSYVNAANFKSELNITGLLCKGEGLTFENASTPKPTKSVWEFPDGYKYELYNGQSAMHAIQTAGEQLIKLTNHFGGCVDLVEKMIEIKNNPLISPFVTEIESFCGAPVKVNFKDTTVGAVKWDWILSSYPHYQTSEKAPSHIYDRNDSYYPFLTVTNADGCRASFGRPLEIRRPYVAITTNDAALNGQLLSCGPGTFTFNTSTTESITKYLWDFGDGTTSSEATAKHTYSKDGSYRVKLTYELATGCTGTTEFSEWVLIRSLVKASFTGPSEICGNTPVFFTNTSGRSVYHFWSFGDGGIQNHVGSEYGASHKYESEGIFNIQLVVTDGICSDTAVRSLKVKPPFPKISTHTNSCEGDRGTVFFQQKSKQTDNWAWDFGDGNTRNLSSDILDIQHAYSKTGYYKVKLTNTNGDCTVSDSIYIKVLKKQQPVLTSTSAEACQYDKFVRVEINNLEKNPDYDYNTWGYGVTKFEYTDGSQMSYNNFGEDGYGLAVNLIQHDKLPITFDLRNFDTGKNGFRAITNSGYFGCADTSNFIPMKIKGPIVGFKINERDCSSSNTIYFEDTSRATGNIALNSWQWSFGDGRGATYSKPGEISHPYMYEGMYYTTLKVTDAEGCSGYARSYVYPDIYSVVASFHSSATNISPGTTVYLQNTSRSSDETNTTYTWVFHDGSTSAGHEANFHFKDPGTYKILLIARNSLRGCVDTANTTITVKFVNAAFNFNSSYISNSKCPPVKVQFNNTSYNAQRITWDFGDGTIVHNNFNPSHIYTRTGKFYIIVRTYSENNTEYITRDSIEIKSPSVNITADKLFGCTSQAVTLNANVPGYSAYTWDPGDGRTRVGSDSFLLYQYQYAGIYHPRLVVMDENGCASSVELNNAIVIDSLSVSLSNVPSTICSPKEVAFNPTLSSVSGENQLKFHWDFGTGQSNDTAATRDARFTYPQTGKFTVTLSVQSDYGCAKQVSKTIEAFQGLGGFIEAPSQVCEQLPVQFAAKTLIPGSPGFKWIFDDGTVSTQQNPAAKKYSKPGVYPTVLLVDNNGCMDSVKHLLQVYPNPAIQINTRAAVVCEGSSIAVDVIGGATYQWDNSSEISDVNAGSVSITPKATAIYAVRVGTEHECYAKDSIKLTVAYPFRLTLPAEVNVCQGDAVLISASGAASYQWIGETSGLNNTLIPTPLAGPTQSKTYTLVGTDMHKCFTDTARILVNVKPVPTVFAGDDVEILAGAAHTFNPVTSADVISFAWSPAKYLTCTSCLNPQSNPLEPIDYQLTVRNQYGCTASDTVSVKLLCSETRIGIPNVFTPNNDGKNDVFAIKGNGIRKIHYLKIFNRWGQIIFERTNFQIDDPAGAWAGTFKGLPVGEGTYVYVAEMSCNEQTFIRKGTVTLTR